MRPFWLLSIAILTLILACGGDDDDSPGPERTATATDTPAGGADPEGLALTMVGVYETMNEELVALLDRNLPPDDLGPEIAALKEEYIEAFVAMGRERETYSADKIAAFNRAATSALFSVDSSHQDMVNDVLRDLNATGEHDLANEISSFNILTQYAQFELLWDQEPDEAERLNLPSPAHVR
jgi:hypothetical protein